MSSFKEEATPQALAINIFSKATAETENNQGLILLIHTA